MSDEARIPQAKNRVVPVLAVESAKYFLVSAAALALDYGLLVGLTELARLNYLVSAGLGFSAGVVLSYILSVRFVFSERRLESRRLEMMVFFLIGLAGLRHAFGRRNPDEDHCHPCPEDELMEA